jgi:hypothetical protein
VTLAAAHAQDPCDAATFNGKVCYAAVKGGGYCSQGSRVSMSYPQAYPYYYDRYRDYMSQGGAVTQSSAAKCPRLSVHAGFGSTAVVHARTAGS